MTTERLPPSGLDPAAVLAWQEQECELRGALYELFLDTWEKAVGPPADEPVIVEAPPGKAV